MNIYEAFETDDQATAEGVWLDIVFQGATVCEVRVRSASPDLNPELRKAMTDRALGLIKDKGALEAQGAKDPDLELDLFAECVVTGWRGVTDRKGKALKCTPANARRVFRELPLLFKQVKAAAYRWESFRTSTLQAAVGNSKRSSGQNSGESRAATLT